MAYICPVCSKEFSENLKKCALCGFTDDLGLHREWPIAEDAQRWLETVVKPYREKWHNDLASSRSFESGNTRADERQKESSRENSNAGNDDNSFDSSSLDILGHKFSDELLPVVGIITDRNIDNIRMAHERYMNNNMNNLNAWDYILKGDERIKNKKYMDALREFASAIELNDQFKKESCLFHIYTCSLARTYSMDFRNEYIEIFELYKNEKNILLHLFIFRARNFCSIGEYKNAINDCKVALRMDPNFPLGYLELGKAHFGEKEYNQALIFLKKAVQLESNMKNYNKLYPMKDFYYYRGRAFAQTDNFNLNYALEDFSKAIQLGDNDGGAHNRRGHVYLLQGWYNEAFNDFEAAILLDIDNEDYRYDFEKAKELSDHDGKRYDIETYYEEFEW